jgi:osmotically inducible protein OsmC
MPTRTANAVWEGGGLKSGKGTFKGQTGLSGQYNFSSRFEDGAGSNPEELLAAAHAACYAMALGVGLEQAGKPPQKISADAAATIDKVGAGFEITKIVLTVRANVPGIDEPTFQKIAQATKEGCPVSKALKAVPKIELDAKLV